MALEKQKWERSGGFTLDGSGSQRIPTIIFDKKLL